MILNVQTSPRFSVIGLIGVLVIALPGWSLEPATAWDGDVIESETPVPDGIPGEAELRHAIAGKWILKSAQRGDDRLKPDAAELVRDSTIEFMPGFLSQGKVRWNYRLDVDSDPMRLELSRGEETRKAICYFGSNLPYAGHLTIVIPAEGAGFPTRLNPAGTGNLQLNYIRDKTDPDWLEAEAARLRKLAADLLLHGNGAQQEFARELQEQVRFLDDEIAVRRKAQAEVNKAKTLKASGKETQAKLLEERAQIRLIQLEADLAEQEATRRLREREKDLKQEVEDLTAMAASFREDGQFDKAREFERRLQQLLLSRDPDLKRANDLKRRAAEARLEGKHRDAELYDREAERLLAVVEQRYLKAGTADPASNTRADRQRPPCASTSSEASLPTAAQAGAAEN